MDTEGDMKDKEEYALYKYSQDKHFVNNLWSIKFKTYVIKNHHGFFIIYKITMDRPSFIKNFYILVGIE
ncbi:hypothetical protein EYC84_011011 [Monilinia fructicola]|uniref:Uncharacterized protein n=1 Tax=Monilinia fructicola TaxID=38448 RepID=A0A5M9J6V3_MONFR|nr:hypothetical protein EYC84_011011 [Monilinia fructicola]